MFRVFALFRGEGNRVYLVLFSLLLFRSLKLFVFLSLIGVTPLWYKLLVTVVTGYILLFIFLRRRWLTVIFFLVEDFWILLNAVYYIYFGHYFHLISFFYHLESNFTSVRESSSFLSAVNVVSWVDRFLIVLIDLPFVILILTNKIFEGTVRFLRSLYAKVIFAFSLALILFVEVFNALSNRGMVNLLAKAVSQDISYKDEKLFITYYGTLFMNIVDIVYLIDDKLVYRIVDYGRELRFDERGKKKNIIAIQVESLDSSVVFTDYKGKPITPFLRSLTTNSLFFPITVSYHFAGYTSDAEFTILNSLHPLRQIPSMKYWKDNRNSLARIFSENGYKTWAFHGNSGVFFGRNEAYKRWGFVEFFDIHDMSLEESGWGAKDEDVFEFVKNFLLTNTNDNYFAYIITMSSHGPFTLVDNYYTNELFDDIENEVVRNYFNSISYVDSVLSNFVAFAKKNFKDTVLFIYGDHHSSVGDSEYYRRSVSYVDGRLIDIVPLFIISEGFKMIVHEPVSFLSIAPTMIDVAGVKAKIRTKGVSLIRGTEKSIYHMGEYVPAYKIKEGLNFYLPSEVK